MPRPPQGGVAPVGADEARGLSVARCGPAGLVAMLSMFCARTTGRARRRCVFTNIPSGWARWRGRGGGGSGVWRVEGLRAISEILWLASGRVTRTEPQTSCKNNSEPSGPGRTPCLCVGTFLVCVLFFLLRPLRSPAASRGSSRVGWARIAVVWLVVMEEVEEERGGSQQERYRPNISPTGLQRGRECENKT